MLTKFITIDGVLHPTNDIIDNCWICLTSPNYNEVTDIADHFNIDIDDIKSALDLEESSRIEINTEYTLILVDIPSREYRNGNEAYTTIPLAILLTDTNVITVCAEDTPVLTAFKEGRVKEIDTAKKMRFIYQILYNNTIVYLTFLRQIDISRQNIEAQASVYQSTKNTDLIKLHELESNLVYFDTSLRGNNIILDKLSRYDSVKRYPEDMELLNDVLIENAQAIEMAKIYRDILIGTRELLASLIDNTLNTVMKRLTSITIIMAIPTIISGFYGMNVNSDGMPLASVRPAFFYISIITAITCIAAAFILKKKNLF